MKVLKQIFDFYLNSSIHVALAVCCLTYISILNFDLERDINLLFFTFFASITGYNFVKYFGIAKFHHRSLTKRLKHIQIFSFFSFLALVYFVFQLSERTLWFLGGLATVTFFYAIPFLPKRMFIDGGKNLRAIGGLKIYVIAFVWAATTVVIPIINVNHAVDHDVLLTTFQRFIYVIIAILPFEIRDIQYDSLKLSTIPQRIGVKQTKLIGGLLLVPFFFIEFFRDDMTDQNVIVIFIVAIISFMALLFSKVTQSEYYSSFVVEGIPVIWLLLNLI